MKLIILVFNIKYKNDRQMSINMSNFVYLEYSNHGLVLVWSNFFFRGCQICLFWSDKYLITKRLMFALWYEKI